MEMITDPVDPDEGMEFIMLLKHPDVGCEDLERLGSCPSEPRFDATLNEILTTTTDGVKAVRRWASRHNFTIMRWNEMPADVRLRARVEDIECAFDIKMRWWKIDEDHHERHLAPEDPTQVLVPDQCASKFVFGVLGLDQRPPLGLPTSEEYWSRPVAPPSLEKDESAPLTVVGVYRGPSLNVRELASLYNFPRSQYGAIDQRIGIIVLGGGLSTWALEPYFNAMALDFPTIRISSVDTAQTVPPRSNKIYEFLEAYGLVALSPTKPAVDLPPLNNDVLFTIEAMMDVEIASTAAPKAAISVTFAPQNALGIHDAIVYAAQNERVDVLCNSWGFPESSMATMRCCIDRALAYATCYEKVTVMFASGDFGSTADPTKPVLMVNYPASSPWVVGCGGSAFNSTNTEEVVWQGRFGGQRSASGGGYSMYYTCPEWQSSVNDQAMRGVPDLAANASSNLFLRYDSTVAWSFGTSAAAPILAGLIACINQQLGQRVGWLTPLLYDDSVIPAIVNIMEGNNSVSEEVSDYTASEGWNPCCGLGRPNGDKLLAALKKLFDLPQ